MGFCLILGNELSEETHMLTEQEAILYWEGFPRQRAAGEGTQENCCAMQLAVSGFMGMRLVSGLALANRLAWLILELIQGPFRWHVHLSAKMDSAPNSSSRGWFVRSIFLLGSPVMKELIQFIIVMPGQGGQFRSKIT